MQNAFITLAYIEPCYPHNMWASSGKRLSHCAGLQQSDIHWMQCQTAWFCPLAVNGRPQSRRLGASESQHPTHRWTTARRRLFWDRPQRSREGSYSPQSNDEKHHLYERRREILEKWAFFSLDFNCLLWLKHTWGVVGRVCGGWDWVRCVCVCPRVQVRLLSLVCD